MEAQKRRDSSEGDDIGSFTRRCLGNEWACPPPSPAESTWTGCKRVTEIDHKVER